MIAAYVDTSALLALLDADDRVHARVTAAFGSLAEDGAVLHTSSYVLVETGALVKRRLGADAFRRFGATAERALQVLWVDELLHQRAWEHAAKEGPSRPQPRRLGGLSHHGRSGSGCSGCVGLPFPLESRPDAPLIHHRTGMGVRGSSTDRPERQRGGRASPARDQGQPEHPGLGPLLSPVSQQPGAPDRGQSWHGHTDDRARRDQPPAEGLARSGLCRAGQPDVGGGRERP